MPPNMRHATAPRHSWTIGSKRLSLVVRILCFFSSYGDPLDLHSFPTRRSSDLLSPIPPSTPPSAASTTANVVSSVRLRNARARSEEHTSELQSQSNLVCRLLLEKKKK